MHIVSSADFEKTPTFVYNVLFEFLPSYLIVSEYLLDGSRSLRVASPRGSGRFPLPARPTAHSVLAASRNSAYAPISPAITGPNHRQFASQRHHLPSSSRSRSPFGRGRDRSPIRRSDDYFGGGPVGGPRNDRMSPLPRAYRGSARPSPPGGSSSRNGPSRGRSRERNRRR